MKPIKDILPIVMGDIEKRILIKEAMAVCGYTLENATEKYNKSPASLQRRIRSARKRRLDNKTTNLVKLAEYLQQ